MDETTPPPEPADEVPDDDEAQPDEEPAGPADPDDWVPL
ncbi:hypothetical protein SAMN04488563_4910 [Jiangella alkaliphila]|uniref:Uncharacterized protein n=1 Tax=Jiangella alkaliphila TaxID=419479 RepID=A0A1H2L2Y5_9ACTN|nr:hypothetical protein SAMN04488563_4910 [Jiangella alkaliphila]